MAAYFQVNVKPGDYDLPFLIFGSRNPNAEAWLEWNLRTVKLFIASGKPESAALYAKELVNWARLAYNR